MDYINKLSSYTNAGKKEGKEFLLNYYSKIGSPQNKLKVIHVTGTAGKGSTSAMIANGLKLAGYKVGLFTSPHLFKLNERIKINNENISDEDLNNHIKYFFEKFPGISFSEYLTLIAVKSFLDKNVDFVVCEAFVGGEYDSTNIFNSIATAITGLGLDHQNLLGNTKEKILKDKLGIIRKDIPLFTRLNDKIIDDKIKEIKAKYIKVDRIEETNLKGNFQKENAGIAFEILNYLDINKDTIRNSLRDIDWEGRVQFIEKNILVDCAHNPLGMENLKEYVDTLDFDNIYYLFAISKNKHFKDYEKYMKDAKEIVFTKPNVFKIEDPKNYAPYEKIIENSTDAYNYIKNKLKDNDLLVVCGSIYLASEILTIKNKTSQQTSQTFIKKLIHTNSMTELDVTDTNFQTEVIEKSKTTPVVVDFWASWCGPCVALKPTLEKVAKEYEGKMILAKAATDDNADAAAKYGIMSIPAVKLFKDGEVVDEFVGAQPEAKIKEWLDQKL